MIDNTSIQLIGGSLRTDRNILGGTVTVDGSPARKRVFVVKRGTFELLAATDSDPVSGAWRLHGLPEYPVGSLIVFAFDDTGQFNTEVADYVSQGQGNFFN